MIEAARSASSERMAEICSAEWLIVPQSPRVAVAMWISQPRSRRRIMVPAQRISASSGWAIIASATLRVGFTI